MSKLVSKETALANLAFIRDTLNEIRQDDPSKHDLINFHIAESFECIKTVEQFIKQEAVR